jgi:hypothetical protein
MRHLALPTAASSCCITSKRLSTARPLGHHMGQIPAVTASILGAEVRVALV